MQVDFSPIVNSTIYQNDVTKLGVTGTQRGTTIWVYILLFVSVVGWPYLIYRLVQAQKRGKENSEERAKHLAEFARLNNFEFSQTKGWTSIQNAEEDEKDGLPYKTEQIVDHLKVTGVVGEYDFSYRLASLFVRQQNKSSQWPTIIFTITLPVDMPRMFLNARSNNLPGLDADAVNFEQATDHVLEGDFPEFYEVRIEKNQHIDMYTVLTPEVMSALKDNNQFDVFVAKNRLTFVTFGDEARFFAFSPVVFKNAELLMKEVDRIARAIRSQS